MSALFHADRYLIVLGSSHRLTQHVLLRLTRSRGCVNQFTSLRNQQYHRS